GTWTLRVRDDAALTNGELRGWSINFQRPYEIQYEWSSEAAIIDCPSCPDTEATAISEGPVILRVTDSYGCQLVDSFQITFDDLPSFDPPVCDMVTDSSISIDWGDSPEALFYEVSTDGINWTAIGTSSEFTLNGLGFNEETQIYVRAQFQNCAGPAYPISCITTSCVPPSIETVVTTTCAGGTSSSVELIASGGQAPYTYYIDGVQNANELFEGLDEGVYVFTVADDRSCSDSVEITITNPPAFDGQLEVLETINCNGAATGILVATPDGGEGPFLYEWNGTSGDSTLSDLSAGEYELVITDANGCVFSQSVELQEPDPLEALANSTNQNCDGSENGTASVFMDGGTPSYTYSWSIPGQGNNQTATGLVAGDYTVTVTDANSCEIEVDISVGLEPPVEVETTSIDATCSGENDGSISTTVNIGLAPLQYDWSGPVIPAGPDANNLPAGTYNLTITDARNCQFETSFNIMEPDEIQVAANVEDVNCEGQSTGLIELTPSGGTEPYTFAWDDESDQEDRENLPAGTYELNLIDANGCDYSQTYVIGEEPAIVLSFDVSGTDCPDDNTGSLTTLIENGTGPFEYDWSNDEVTPDLDGLAAGTYQLEVTDDNGCTALAEVVVPGPPPFVAEVVTESVRCHGAADGLIELDLSGGTPAYRFRLDGGAWQRPNSFIGLLPGRYTLEAEDENGCTIQLDGLVVDEPDPFTVSLGEDLIIDWGDSVLLSPVLLGGTLPAGRFEWLPEDSLLFSCLSCPEPWVAPLDQTSIRLRVYDALGCIAEDILTILVEKSFPVLVPTGFTPNGDRSNDILVVHGQPGVEILEFQIFDRWGEQVYQNGGFEVNNELLGWDGTYRGQPMNGGVFLWQLVALLPDGSEAEFYGQTTLIR
ncbi:MAG: gliding motility-associated C-terminal domain-containing protein, partial [Bacteroidota bacterium]